MKHFKLLSAIIAAAIMVGSARAYTLNSTQTDMLNDYNTFRISKWLSTVTANEKLMNAAQTYACKMKATHYFAHVEANWTTPTKRAKAAWYVGSVWENLAQIYKLDKTSAYVLSWWIASPGHYRNMINKQWTEAGFWRCGIYRVQMFGKPITIRPVTNTGVVVNNTTVVDNRYYTTKQAQSVSNMTPIQWSILINDTHALKWLSNEELLQWANDAVSQYLNGKTLYMK